MESVELLIEPTIKGMTWLPHRMSWLNENMSYVFAGIFGLIFVVIIVIVVKQKLKYG